MTEKCPDQKCHDKVVKLITICSIAGSGVVGISIGSGSGVDVGIINLM